MTQFCRILLRRLNAIDTHQRPYGSYSFEAICGRIEVIAETFLDEKMEIDAHHDELVAAFENKRDELDSYKLASTMRLIAAAITRIKNEKARLSAFV